MSASTPPDGPPPGAPAIQTAARLLAAGRAAEAAERLRRLVLEAPTYAAAHVLLASALDAAGRPADALDVWRRAAFLVPHSPLVHRERQRLMDAQNASSGATNAETRPAPEAEKPEADGSERPTPPPDAWDAGEPNPASADERTETPAPDAHRPDPEPAGPAPRQLDAADLVPSPFQEQAAESDEQTAALSQPDGAEVAAEVSIAAETEAAETQAAETQAAETQAAETQAAETQAADATDPDPPPGVTPTASAEDSVPDVPPAEDRREPLDETPLLPPEEDPEPATPRVAADDELEDDGWTLIEDDAVSPPRTVTPEPTPLLPPEPSDASLAAPLEPVTPYAGDAHVADDLDDLISQLDAAPRIKPDPTFQGPAVTFDEASVDDMASETLAKIYAAQRQYGQAARIYETLAVREPDRADAHLGRAAELREKAGE